MKEDLFIDPKFRTRLPFLLTYIAIKQIRAKWYCTVGRGWKTEFLTSLVFILAFLLYP